MPSSHYKKILLLVTLLVLLGFAFFLRLWPIPIAHWWDETVYLQNAEVVFSGRTNYDEWSFRPPLLPLLFAAGFLVHHSFITASIISVLLSLLVPLFIFLAGKDLYGQRTGIIAGLFAGFTPFLVRNSRYLMTDIPSLGLICAGFYFLILAHRRMKDTHYAIAGIIFSLATLMRFTSLILLFIIPIYFIILKISTKKLLPVAVSAGIILFPYFIWAQISQGFFLRPFLLASGMVGDVNTSNYFYLQNFSVVFSYLILAGFLVSLFFITRLYFDKKNLLSKAQQTVLRTEFVLVLWIAVYFIYICTLNHKEPRYLLPITLPLLLLSASGCNQLIMQKNKFVRYTCQAAFVFFFILTVFPSFTVFQGEFYNTYKTQEMHAAEYINAQYPSDIIICADNNYPVFAYYTGKMTFNANDVSAISLEKKGRILFIVYADAHTPLTTWVNNQSLLTNVKNFETIQIYEYP